MRQRGGAFVSVGHVAVVVLCALVLRVWLPWPGVFRATGVNLLEADAWYHLRAAENLVEQFPHRLQSDPYADPAGTFVQVAPLFDVVLAGTALITGFGHPSPSHIAAVAALVPPLLGGLTVALVYAIARLCAGHVAGLLAAALAATIPGPFLTRTLLGYADHHALEACLSTLVLMCVVRPLVRQVRVPGASVALGLALIAYRLSWTSAAFLVAVLGAWLALHVALHIWHRADGGNVHRVVGMAAGAGLVPTLAFRDIEPFLVGLYVAALSIVALLSLLAEAGQRGLRAGWWMPRRLIITACGALGAGAIASFVLLPASTAGVVRELSRFSPWSSTNGLVAEASSLLRPGGAWSLLPTVTVYGSGFLLGLLAIGVLLVRWRRGGPPVNLLLVTWTLAMYLAAIGQSRFGYYLVPTVAVACGVAFAPAIRSAWQAGRWRRGAMVLLVLVPGLGVNSALAVTSARQPAGLPAAWLPAFQWLRDSAEEPFGDPGYYYARYSQPLPPPRSTVMAWWDYGYWITAAAHRVPVANPTQSGAREAGAFFTATDEARALAMLDGASAHYVFVDDLLPFRLGAPGTIIGKFMSMAQWAGTPTARFYSGFLIRDGDHYREQIFFFPDYYRTIAFRLAVLSGRGYEPFFGTPVVSWTTENVPGFGRRKVVTALETYPTLEAASARLRELGAGEHAIVGVNPLMSPVPLEPVRGLRLAYRTPAPGAIRAGAVQIFERR